MQEENKKHSIEMIIGMVEEIMKHTDCGASVIVVDHKNEKMLAGTYRMTRNDLMFAIRALSEIITEGTNQKNDSFKILNKTDKSENFQ